MTIHWPPDYKAVLIERFNRLNTLRERPELWIGAKAYYAQNPVAFINDWAVTYDPRNAGRETPSTMPFILFKRQEELITCLWQCIILENNGLVEKCRDMGATWLCAAFSVWLWLFWDGSSIGWGSRKEQLVDKLGDADSIFEKIRIIIRYLPVEFLPKGFNENDHMPFMRILNPETGSSITGEAGDNIGRGGRKLIYFKDESAHYERPEKIEAALADTTRVQIDISSVNGLGNVFHRRRESGEEWSPLIPMSNERTAVFIMDWTDHPGKNQEWYDKRRKKAADEGLLHKFAQEVDRNYASAVEGIIIKPEWVKAALDVHKKLNITITGKKFAGLDVADEGGDKHALARRRGILLDLAEHWGEGDTGATARKAVSMLSGSGEISVMYDSVGVGAGVKSETNRLKSINKLPDNMEFVPWSAGAKCLFPKKRLIPGDTESPLNEDFYANLKAQGWWQLARRFERTWRAVNEPDFTWEEDDLISLSTENLPLLRQIEKELCQATYSHDGRAGRLIIDKSPEGTRSPNLADAIVMAFWPIVTKKYNIDAWG